MARGENKNKMIKSGGALGYSMEHRSHLSDPIRFIQKFKLDEKYHKEAQELLKKMQEELNLVANGKKSK